MPDRRLAGRTLRVGTAHEMGVGGGWEASHLRCRRDSAARTAPVWPTRSGPIVAGHIACDHEQVSSELSWPQIAARLAPVRNYWLVTASATGEPHTAPVWGCVLGGLLHLFTERQSVKARNIAANPRVVIHLENAEDVLIVHGVAADIGTPAQTPEVVAALDAKYTDPADRAYLPSAEPAYDVIYAIRPRSALTWQLDDFVGSQRRWPV